MVNRVRGQGPRRAETYSGCPVGSHGPTFHDPPAAIYPGTFSGRERAGNFLKQGASDLARAA